MTQIQETLARPIDGHCTVHFLSAGAARRAILDDRLLPFFSEISQIDRAVRMQCSLAHFSLAEQKNKYRAHLQSAVCKWSEREIQALLKHCQDAARLMRSAMPGFPPLEWKFLKSSGAEEAHAPYCRNDVVVLPQSKLQNLQAPDFVRMLIHETFHVWSRLYPEKRDRCYARLGFRRLPQLELGNWYKAHKLTNPDGAHINYAIEVEHEGRKLWAAPLLYSDVSDYHGKGQLFDYVKFGLFEVTCKDEIWALMNPEQPKVLAPNEVQGFYEQITHNTGYILHPDEILASNVELLALEQNIPEEIAQLSPAGLKLLQDLRQILQS